MKRLKCRYIALSAIAWAVLVLCMPATGLSDPGIDYNTLSVKGMVTMIDLGLKKG